MSNMNLKVRLPNEQFIKIGSAVSSFGKTPFLSLEVEKSGRLSPFSKPQKPLRQRSDTSLPPYEAKQRNSILVGVEEKTTMVSGQPGINRAPQGN